MSTPTEKKKLFVMADGKNLVVTFALVSSLFLLWGFCNGMIDVMDKHFQDELNLTLAQSANVQFAHYLGYFLMSVPAGWLATKLGYKMGIIIGLLMVAVGGLWFVPATMIAQFWAFLVGVCFIASGLTFLETIANPYTTVLGPNQYAATRINLAQSCNGIGWILGPIVGSMYFYSKDTAGQSTGSQTLWIPYAGIAVVVSILAVIFWFADVPDIKSEDDYHLDDKDAEEPAERQLNRPLLYVLLCVNAVLLAGVFGMITSWILSALHVDEQSIKWAVYGGAGGLVVLSALVFLPLTAKMSHHSIWSHPHFSGAVIAQFLYVAAQAGIFSFLINYMTSEVPAMAASLHTETTKNWIEVRTTLVKADIKDLPALAERLKAKKPDPVSAYVKSQLSEATLVTLDEYKTAKSDAEELRSELTQDLNKIVKQDPDKEVKKEVKKAEKEGVKKDPNEVRKSVVLYCDPARFSDAKLSEATKKMLAQKIVEDKQKEAEDKLPEEKRPSAKEKPEMVNLRVLNRMLLKDSYPGDVSFDDSIFGFSDKAASLLASVGFVCFLIGRFSGAALLKKVSAHRILGLYGLLNAAACVIVFLKLGWTSVVCVFLSYFFMSIMFPTIFALGIFGLGARAKKASAFIVMAIMGGALLPKLMGHIADEYNMSRSFIVPIACFALIALYGYCWPKLSGADSLSGVKTSGH
jgi:fucose permease